MFIYFQSILCDCLSVLFGLLIIVDIPKIRATVTFNNDFNNIYVKQTEEYIMTSANIDGIKRSNVCGDGYRIEGALLKSYPYSKGVTYLPYEDCSMTFQTRRSNNQIRIHIMTLDLNDIESGTNCFDSLRFYKSPFMKREDKLDSVECGQLTEADNFSIISPTGIVTAHFNTDGGNVNGLGFKVILTAFRLPNKTHQCDPYDEEFLCKNGECISSYLLCDGIPHCLDGSDETPNQSCHLNFRESLTKTSQSNDRAIQLKHRHWRGISLATFLFLIIILFILFLAYFLFRRYVKPPVPLMNTKKKTYATMVNSPLNGPKSEVILHNRKHLDDDYNLV